MLEDIEHEDEGVAAPRTKAGIERRYEDALEVWTIGRNERALRFHAFDDRHAIKPGQSIEEQSIAAADIEDGAPTGVGLMRAQHVEDDTLACPPPPVVVEEIAIMRPVLRIHVRRVR